MREIEKAAVIGAGVMGAALAAQLADAGVAVTLLDTDAAIADAGIAHQTKVGGFVDTASAARIRSGSTATDMALLADADWIIEAATEVPMVKQAILAAVDAVRKAGSIVSSNTSTIPLARLTAGMDRRFAADFVITHFFNPPRRMILLEIVGGGDTRPQLVEQISAFAERRLGKVVVPCRDTPGFIANRLGNYWMATVLDEALSSGLPIEEVDAVTGKAIGMPVGVFELLDLVGIDLLPQGWASLQSELPSDDALQTYQAAPPLIARMIAENRIGSKAGCGFRRRQPDGTLEALDLIHDVYRPATEIGAPAVAAAGNDLAALLAHDSPAGRFALAVVVRMLTYAASLIPTVADAPARVDKAMRYGYGWRLGPFAMIERLGWPWLVDQLKGCALPIPKLIDATPGGDEGVSAGLRDLLPDDGTIASGERNVSTDNSR